MFLSVNTLREISRQRALWSGWAGPGQVVSGRLIVLNCSASPKMVMKKYFNFFRFYLKDLEMFECRRGDPYITANRSFVRFAHSYLHSIYTRHKYLIFIALLLH